MAFVASSPVNYEVVNMSVFKKHVRGAMTYEEASALLEEELASSQLILEQGQELTCFSNWCVGKAFANGVKKQLFDELRDVVFGKKTA